jgi:hypothetical protein
MNQIFICIVFFFLFCKPDPLPKYESYLYKPVSSRDANQLTDIAAFIKELETENSLDFIKSKNPTAYIPAMCYTKTMDSSGKAHNPCYACHTKGEKPNFLDDSDLQTHYEFPKVGKINPWKNLFTFKNANSYSDVEIENYIKDDNYKDDKGEIILSKKLPVNWGGYVPDCYFHFDEDGFDKNPKTGEYSGWRAYRYYPFLGTFWATNGSTDDVLIRLPFPFRADKNRKFDLEIYKTNLSIIEAFLKQKTIQTETLDESVSGIDLDKNGKLEKTNQLKYTWSSTEPMRYAGMAEDYQTNKELLTAGGLFPVGTEFLHSVRYLDWNKEANTVMLSKRMKELRYARKNEWYNYSELKDKVSREKKDLRFRTEKTPEGFHGDYEHGFDNKSGWVYQGYIEDKKGNLRPQTNEETLFCIGCHSSLGVLADSIFSFNRKMEGSDKSKVDFGWAHWSSKGISGVGDRTVSFKNFGEQNEYSFYLQNNQAGDEFRENEEIKKIFFQKDGTLNHEAFTKLKSDVGILINPSRERSILLNKSYRAIVESQSFRFGRDAILKKPTNVFEKIPDGQTTGIEKIVF